MKEFEGKRLLILGGFNLACVIVRHAQALGAYVVVADYNENAMAKDIADKFALVSATDVDALVELCKEEKIDDSTLSGFSLAKYKLVNQPMVIAGVNRYLDDLADGLLNLCYLFDPEIIVLAGGITEGNLIDIKYLKEKLNNCGYEKCELKLSAFKGKAGLIGASIIAK